MWRGHIRRTHFVVRDVSSDGKGYIQRTHSGERCNHKPYCAFEKANEDQSAMREDARTSDRQLDCRQCVVDARTTVRLHIPLVLPERTTLEQRGIPEEPVGSSLKQVSYMVSNARGRENLDRHCQSNGRNGMLASAECQSTLSGRGCPRIRPRDLCCRQTKRTKQALDNCRQCVVDARTTV